MEGIVESGGADLALHLEEHGYDWVREKYENGTKFLSDIEQTLGDYYE